MDEMTVRLKGTTPLLIHNNRAANPLNDYSKAMKSLTAKRNKTDKDYEYIARVEWEAGLYLHDGIVAIPARVVEKTFLNGAKKIKLGTKYSSGAMLRDDYLPLMYAGAKIKIDGDYQKEIPNLALDPFYETHKNQEMVRVGKNQVLRTRPIFHDWSLDVAVFYDEGQLNRRAVKEIMEAAGSFVGMCEQRPRMGRFSVEDA